MTIIAKPYTYHGQSMIGPLNKHSYSGNLTVLARSIIGIVGSNPTADIGVCPRFSELCCPE